ncbi:helix-turn-helix domain-containing protein [Nonomuraea sp. SBT364]|uniref:helix-turn-helix domain-containing protein n=1 Tax=Nonomuraea sp. SBT364 TaxID=1580530 RepID=UPI00066B9023|nr:helix-turn-helix domain-containing protein [Nonomuraea sp. SBT364]
MTTTTAPPTGCICGGCSCGGDQLFYDIPDVMRILGISKKSVEKLINSGDLDSTLVLTRRKVYRASVSDYLTVRADLATAAQG